MPNLIHFTFRDQNELTQIVDGDKTRYTVLKFRTLERLNCDRVVNKRSLFEKKLFSIP